ncbi:hypothetical protein Bbelb_319400 [Branchiostoma belcheri]|nr:hypothetical protein Bbelb_319400 [Branchiostoma belcheri]
MPSRLEMTPSGQETMLSRRKTMPSRRETITSKLNGISRRREDDDETTGHETRADGTRCGAVTVSRLRHLCTCLPPAPRRSFINPCPTFMLEQRSHFRGIVITAPPSYGHARVLVHGSDSQGRESGRRGWGHGKIISWMTSSDSLSLS